MDERLHAKIQEAVDAVNEVIRKEHLTIDESIAYLRGYLAAHAPEEVRRFQELQTRKDLH
jgi:hypothetical protein